MYELSLNICDLDIKLIFHYSSNTSFYEKFKNTLFERYRSFIANSQNSDIIINIEYINNMQEPISTKPPKYNVRNNILFIDKQDIYGSFSLSENTGSFSVFPSLYSIDSLLRLFFSVFLVLRHDGFLIHASSIIMEDKGYIFTGPSGAGKSTIVILKENLKILSDEIVAVKKDSNNFYVYGTPFMSKFVFGGLNAKAKIDSIFFLNKNKNHYKEPVKGIDKINKLLPNILFFARDNVLSSKLLDITSDFANCINVFDLYFAKDDGVYDIII